MDQLKRKWEEVASIPINHVHDEIQFEVERLNKFDKSNLLLSSWNKDQDVMKILDHASKIVKDVETCNQRTNILIILESIYQLLQFNVLHEAFPCQKHRDCGPCPEVDSEEFPEFILQDECAKSAVEGNEGPHVIYYTTVGNETFFTCECEDGKKRFTKEQEDYFLTLDFLLEMKVQDVFLSSELSDNIGSSSVGESIVQNATIQCLEEGKSDTESILRILKECMDENDSSESD